MSRLTTLPITVTLLVADFIFICMVGYASGVLGSTTSDKFLTFTIFSGMLSGAIGLPIITGIKIKKYNDKLKEDFKLKTLNPDEKIIINPNEELMKIIFLSQKNYSGQFKLKLINSYNEKDEIEFAL